MKALTSASQLDWQSVRAAAQRILRCCDDVGFVAPEDLHASRRYIEVVCVELDAIVKALLITPPGSKP